MSDKKMLLEDILDDLKAEHPEWEESYDDIKAKYETEEEIDDKEGDGYTIKSPYIFYDVDGTQMQADYIEPFHNDFAIAKMNGRYSFIDKEGKLIVQEWFRAANDFENERAMVKRTNGTSNYLKPDGTFLFPNGVNRCSDFINGVALVINGGRRYKIDVDGNEIE